MFRWINSAEIDRGKISVSFHETVWPHLFNLSERFTQYSFFNVLAFENRYSSRLYDVLSAVCYLGGGSFEIEFLRERLDAENTYVENAHFIRDAVVPAVKEINLFSDLSVQYETVKEGAAIHKINFRVEKKDGLEHPIAQRNTLYALSGEKDKIEEI